MKTDIFIRVGTIEKNIWDELPSMLHRWGYSGQEVLLRERQDDYHTVHPKAIKDAIDRA